MNRVRAQLIRKEATPHGHLGRRAGRLLKAGHRFLAEDAFTRTLRLEKKRTERSGTSFLLMLLSVEETVTSPKREALLLETAWSLFTAVREVDVTGWYRHDVTLGVIFTGITEMSEQVIGKILAKVHGALCDRIGVEQANKVGISVRVLAKTEVGNTLQSGGSSQSHPYTELEPTV